MPADGLLRRGMLLFERRQAFLLGGQAHFIVFNALVSPLCQFCPTQAVGLVLLDVGLPLRLVGFELRQARSVLVARFAPMAYLGFETGHLGARLVVLGLRRLYAVSGHEMLLARCFEARFGVAQGGVLRFELVDHALHLARHPLALGLRLVAAQQPKQLLFMRQFAMRVAVLARHRRLLFQTPHLVAQFGTDVLDARQIVAGIGQAMFGFLAPLLVFGDPGGLFEEDAQLVGARLDDARNRPLADDGVGARAKAGAEKEVGDVLAADVQVVDVVLGLAAARQQTLDRKFGVL